MSKEQYNGIHDIVNDQGFEMHYGAISNTVSHLEVFSRQERNVSCTVNCEIIDDHISVAILNLEMATRILCLG